MIPRKLIVLCVLTIMGCGCGKDRTPLHANIRAAVEQGDLADVRLHIRNGADIFAPPPRNQTSLLFLAASRGHVDIVRFLVSRGADVNVRESDGPFSGATPLHGAASEGHVEVVRYLLRQGADINAVFKGGLTPLMLAAAHGHTETENFLQQQ